MAEVLYPDHVVPLHVGECMISIKSPHYDFVELLQFDAYYMAQSMNGNISEK